MPSAAPHPAGSYRGRFAPTPSGPLHFGSLVAALGSWAQARSQGGHWLLRIDDLDRPRVVPGAGEGILRTLAALGLEWDGAPIYQSERYPAYREALESLRGGGWVYRCRCTRRVLARTARRGDEGPIYPGTCRPGAGKPPVTGRGARRVLTGPEPLAWCDGLFGPQRVNLEREVGDFVLWRADGVCAYHLANVVDDALDGITEVLRGGDLLGSTHRHAYLADRLGHRRPRWFHLPVAVNGRGEKLSKQTRAPALDSGAGGRVLHAALTFLDQSPPDGLARAPSREVLDWALAHWNPAAIRPTSHKPAPSLDG